MAKASETKTFSLKEVKECKDPMLVIHDGVYNVAKFLEEVRERWSIGDEFCVGVTAFTMDVKLQAAIDGTTLNNDAYVRLHSHKPVIKIT